MSKNALIPERRNSGLKGIMAVVNYETHKKIVLMHRTLFHKQLQSSQLMEASNVR